MNIIEDEKYQGDSGFIKYLKDFDFFDIKKFFIFIIVFDKVILISGENKKVMGNLIIKGIIYLVIFLVKIEIKDGII